MERKVIHKSRICGPSSSPFELMLLLFHLKEKNERKNKNKKSNKMFSTTKKKQ